MGSWFGTLNKIFMWELTSDHILEIKYAIAEHSKEFKMGVNPAGVAQWLSMNL